MDIREFVKASMTQVRNMTIQSLEGLTEKEYHWYPGAEANPISFLLLHIGRTEDRYFHRWLDPSTPAVWDQQGLDKEYNLPISNMPQEAGNSWTIQQVREFCYPPLEKILKYLEDVRKDSFRIIGSLDLSTIDEPLRPDRPSQTRGYYLRMASIHEGGHGGAIDYLRGLYRSPGG